MDIKDIITNFNGNPESIDVESILVFFNEKYPNINTRAKVLSQTKRRLMERTPIPGYTNGYEYNVLCKKSGKPVELLGKLNMLVLNRSDANDLKILQKKSHESNIVNDFVISREVVEKLINLINSKDPTEIAIGVAPGRAFD
jgi:hypothetical protein